MQRLAELFFLIAIAVRTGVYFIARAWLWAFATHQRTTNEVSVQKTKGKPGEKVTKEQIEARIKNVEYTVLPGTTTTIAFLTLDNDYTVLGSSACVDPVNFDEEIGEELAFENAFNKLWPLFGFLLAEARHVKRTQE